MQGNGLVPGRGAARIRQDRDGSLSATIYQKHKRMALARYYGVELEHIQECPVCHRMGNTRRWT